MIERMKTGDLCHIDKHHLRKVALIKGQHDQQMFVRLLEKCFTSA